MEGKYEHKNGNILTSVRDSKKGHQVCGLNTISNSQGEMVPSKDANGTSGRNGWTEKPNSVGNVNVREQKHMHKWTDRNTIHKRGDLIWTQNNDGNMKKERM